MALPQTPGRLSEEPRGVIEAPVLQVKSYLGVRAELGLALGSPTFSKDRAGSTAPAPSVCFVAFMTLEVNFTYVPKLRPRGRCWWLLGRMVLPGC